MDKGLGDIARHRLSEVLKESGLSAGQRDHHGFGLTKTSPDEMVSRQLAAAEAAQKQAERVSKQLVETQQQLLSHGCCVKGFCRQRLREAIVQPSHKNPKLV